MSRNSLYDFLDYSPEDGARVLTVPEGKDDSRGDVAIRDASRYSSESTDTAETSIVFQGNEPDLSDSTLLTDYVIVEMADENYIPRVKSSKNSPRAKTIAQVKPSGYKVHDAAPPIGSNWAANSVSGKRNTVRDRRRTFQTHTVQLENPSQFMAKGTACCVEKKPAIPHQMKSVACYHNGKLDVSILGDQDLLAKTDPLSVQITLLPQVRPDNQRTRQHELPPLKNPPRNAAHNKTGDRKITTTSQTTGCQISKKYNRKRVKSTKQLPPLKRVNMKYTLTDKRNNSHFWAPGKSRMEQKIRRDKVAKLVRPLSPLDWDIVRHRAQLPPFNTYTDPEASLRFQKIWCGF